MNRNMHSPIGFRTVLSSGRNIFNRNAWGIRNITGRFKGRLGGTISVITSLIVGFLTVPNNVLYFIDRKHTSRIAGADSVASPPGSSNVPLTPHVRSDLDYSYIYAGVAFLVLGFFAMFLSAVLTYFTARSMRKVEAYQGSSSNRTVTACLVMMNVELAMSVFAGSMELLYRPLTKDAYRLHRVECAIAVFNIVIYALYVVTMTSTVLKGTYESGSTQDLHRDLPDVVTSPAYDGRESMSRNANPFNSQSIFILNPTRDDLVVMSGTYDCLLLKSRTLTDHERKNLELVNLKSVLCGDGKLCEMIGAANSSFNKPLRVELTHHHHLDCLLTMMACYVDPNVKDLCAYPEVIAIAAPP